MRQYAHVRYLCPYVAIYGRLARSVNPLPSAPIERHDMSTLTHSAADVIFSAVPSSLTEQARDIAGHMLAVPRFGHLAVNVGAPAPGAYSDEALLNVQGGFCLCDEPFVATADGAIDATYGHVVTDLLDAGAVWVGNPVDARQYRYGLVALVHGACNARHSVARDLALGMSQRLLDALAYTG